MTVDQFFNLGIASAYFYIPLALCNTVACNWQQIPALLRLVLVAFALFIASCGSGHWLMALSGHASLLLTFSHGLTMLISVPVALAFPVIAGRLRQILLRDQCLTKELQQSQALFHAFLETHPTLLVWIKDESLVNTYSNQALIKQFGLNPSGKRDADWLPQSVVQALTANDRRVLETGKACEFTEMAPTPDGQMHTWLSYKFLLQVGTQRFVGGTATDITEQEQLRCQVELAFRELEQFTYAASHDLKTPLRGIKGLLAILRRKLEPQLTETDRDILAQLQRDCDYAIDLVSGILAYSKLGQTQIKRTQVDVCVLLTEVASRFTERLVALQASLDWYAEMPLLYADRTQLQQVFENLIDNALKYKSEAPPLIKIGLTYQAGMWVFAVSDNGIGVDPSMQDRLFVMFSRLHSRSEIEGAGIGLATIRKIAERHGGTAWIESEGAGKGSTVYFSLRG